MADVISPSVRSRMMAGIKGKNTRPEMLLRKGLHARGFRFRLHDPILPGKPDIVFSKYRAVIFVHGCFWHGHDCHLFKWPSTRKDFWKAKISRNREAEIRTIQKLAELEWRRGVVWECAIKGRGRLPHDVIFDNSATWLRSGDPALEIRGKA